jgi:hypothetical protein
MYSFGCFGAEPIILVEEGRKCGLEAAVEIISDDDV